MNTRRIIGLSFLVVFALLAFVFLFTIEGTVLDDQGHPLIGANVLEKGTVNGTVTDVNGYFTLETSTENPELEISYLGYSTKYITASSKKTNSIQLSQGVMMDEIVVTGLGTIKHKKSSGYGTLKAISRGIETGTNLSTEGYSKIQENKFHKPEDEPLSTISIDVDRASYSNVRRFLNNGSMPPIDAVRIEEMINYFEYEYPQPVDGHPFAVQTTLSKCPWNEKHQVLHLAMQGEDISNENLPPSNLVFLIDVSGSMNSPNKLGLLKSAFKMLANTLKENDSVAIVVYAGNAGLVLSPTEGNNKQAILGALDNLRAGGSTAGGEGIELAYKVAKENYLSDGNNRVILATDGDFNVGASSDAEMVRLIESRRDDGIFLSVLGFGMGNYKDNKMQELADNGNGNHAYIDNLQEARKVLVSEFGGTLHTIAKDVKVQIEFNPTMVAGYRLIGYENRILDHEDFNDDTKDAGELGAGHVVTAMYEIIPAGVASNYMRNVDVLKYQVRKTKKGTDELATVKLRYKNPKGRKSKKLKIEVLADITSVIPDDVEFAISIAEFGLLLRDSKFKHNSSYERIINSATKAKGKDLFGYRSEFIKLVENARDLDDRGLAKH